MLSQVGKTMAVAYLLAVANAQDDVRAVTNSTATDIGGDPKTWTPDEKVIGGDPSTWTPKSPAGDDEKVEDDVEESNEAVVDDEVVDAATTASRVGASLSSYQTNGSSKLIQCLVDCANTESCKGRNQKGAGGTHGVCDGCEAKCQDECNDECKGDAKCEAKCKDEFDRNKSSWKCPKATICDAIQSGQSSCVSSWWCNSSYKGCTTHDDCKDEKPSNSKRRAGTTCVECPDCWYAGICLKLQ